MTNAIEIALTADLAGAAAAVTRAGVSEAQRQAETILSRHLAATAASEPEMQGDATDRQLAWQLTCLRIELEAGLDPFEEVVLLRRAGATWATIARAAGTTRQSAHERWGARVLTVLDRYGTGELGGPVADDDPLMPRAAG